MLKRIFDIIISLIGIILLLPLMCIISIIILITSPGPVFYGSPRSGKNGRIFKMVKFRTMVVNADRIGSLITAGNDPRITPVGRYLRNYKWDELPSFWNVLKGDMSFVGPRPENPKSVDLYNAKQKDVLKVRPGITSLATIKYRYEEEIFFFFFYLEEAYLKFIQDKLEIELEYLQRYNFMTDVRIIIMTIREIFR